MNRLKLILIDMLNHLDDICTKYGIRYYAIGGTFLGAIRHKGFIPWDDDIDVCMPRDDYYRFESIINGEHGKYLVETPQSDAKDFCYSVAKMYDTTTTVVEDVKYQTRRGVYIDIFPLDGIGNSQEEVKKNYRPIDFLNLIFTSRTSIIRPGREKWKNFVIRCATLMPSWIIDEKKIIKKLDDMCAKRRFDDYKYVGVLLTQYRTKYIMPKEIFSEVERYQFEDTSIIGVKDYNKYLSLLFGDWKKLPPVEKQVAGHDFSYIDYDHSYLEDRKNEKQYTKNRTGKDSRD